MTAQDRSWTGILLSIAVGIAISFTITYIFGIQLNESAKLALAVVPPVGATIWAAKAKKIRSARLWAAISHGITFGILNFFVDKAFFDGLRALAT